jgi:hypothetical protein
VNNSNYGWGNLQAGGGMGNTSATYLDGIPLNAPETNIVTLVPTQDLVQEFRIATSNVSPEFGKFGGAVVNMTTKSGTNQFHGGVYEFLRNKLLNANNFFNNATGTPRPSFAQNQAGATLGGPVRRDKTFFFIGWEQYWQRQASPLLTTVPPDAMKSGSSRGRLDPAAQSDDLVLGRPQPAGHSEKTSTPLHLSLRPRSTRRSPATPLR